MIITYKKLYEAPTTETISANISPVMYVTSIPQAGGSEEGGAADAKASSMKRKKKTSGKTIPEIFGTNNPMPCLTILVGHSFFIS